MLLSRNKFTNKSHQETYSIDPVFPNSKQQESKIDIVRIRSLILVLPYLHVGKILMDFLSCNHFKLR